MPPTPDKVVGFMYMTVWHILLLYLDIQGGSI